MGYDAIKGYKIDGDFIREYEMNRELIKDHEYGSLYKVIIELNEEGVKAGVMDSLAESPETIKVDDRTVTMIWSIPWVNEGVHEIENALFYTLDGDRYGTYTWICLKTTW